MYYSSLPVFNLTAFLFLAVVDCSEVPEHRDLRGHVQRVLRGLRHLQLHDLPAELPGEAVSQPGADAGGAESAETSAAALLLPTLAHGGVSAFATYRSMSRSRDQARPLWPRPHTEPLTVKVKLTRSIRMTADVLRQRCPLFFFPVTFF